MPHPKRTGVWRNQALDPRRRSTHNENHVASELITFKDPFMHAPLILPMTINDHPMAMSLWRDTPGIDLSAADERDSMAAYLLRNPGLSQCASIDGSLIGTVLAGHDGRRGYLHHLCVHDKFRHLGVGRQLVASALTALQGIGLDKAHAFLFTDNDEGRKFWERIGWTWRTDIGVVSCGIPGEKR
jgi:putative acetyltransferase